MDLNETPNDSLEVKLETVNEGVMQCDMGLDRELDNSRRSCVEMEESSRKVGERCLVFEHEIQKKRIELELLRGKFEGLQGQKLAFEAEVKELRRMNQELQERILSVEKGEEVKCERALETDDGEMVSGDEGKLLQLMIENRVLEFEKKNAEREAENWKQKCRHLKLRVMQLEESLGIQNTSLAKVMVETVGFDERFKSTGNDEGNKIEGGNDAGNSLHCFQAKRELANCAELLNTSRVEGSIYDCLIRTPRHGEVRGTPDVLTTPSNDFVHIKQENNGIYPDFGVGQGGHVRKRLAFEYDGRSRKMMAPSTPAWVSRGSVGFIDISDSDDECYPPPGADSNVKEKTVAIMDQSDEEDRSCHFSVTPKRKRASNIIASDSESEDDDNIPIGRLTRKHRQYSNPINKPAESSSPMAYSSPVANSDADSAVHRRRRLVKLSQSEERGGICKAKYHSGIRTTEYVNEDDKSDEDGSDSDGDSLRSFIVESSDVSGGIDPSFEPEDHSDSNPDFDTILSELRRSKGPKLKWEFEGDMLAAFGKDPELCMKAVCALFRQQTADEKLCKEALVYNYRGFSKFDALRGTRLAEFLINGDPHGDLARSVKDLQGYDSQALELCKTLATRYSKQLFEIYQNKEDPLWC
ncbi:hypothetical protein Ancab_009145 [Ancistrocladus abbreviatus]